MNVQDEIELLKTQLGDVTGEQAKAELLLQLLAKYVSINGPDAKPYAEQLLLLAEKMPSEHYQAWGLHHLGVVHRLQADYGNSIRLTEQAITLFKQLHDTKGLAKAHATIGAIHLLQGNYTEALKYYSQSLQFMEETGDHRGIAAITTNIGLILHNQGNYPEAQKIFFRTLRIMEEIGNKQGIAACYLNIGNIYLNMKDYPQALDYHLRALKLFEATGDEREIASAYNNIGIVYQHEGSYPEALRYYLLSLNISRKRGDKQSIAVSCNNIGMIQQLQGNYTEAVENHSQALQIRELIGDKWGTANSYNCLGDIYEKRGEHTAALQSKLAALRLSEEIGHKDLIKESSHTISASYKALLDFENALKYHEKYHQVESEMLGEQAQKQLTSLNFMHNLEQKEKQLEIEHLRNVELKQEKDRSENLLLNILPAEVAEELKEKGTAAAKHFDDVTVLFTDFKGFTTISEKLSPQQLVDELHACFSAFDEIITKYHIEKIKTVGDAYLAVSGLPHPSPNHANDLVKAAIEIREFISERAKLKGENGFQVRIGVHSGSVVAGIVGVKKFAYDIWGDTVNTAARMEQNSEAGKINISQTTYELIKDKFDCEYRGEIEAKNKGKLKMYFVGNKL